VTQVLKKYVKYVFTSMLLLMLPPLLPFSREIVVVIIFVVKRLKIKNTQNFKHFFRLCTTSLSMANKTEQGTPSRHLVIAAQTMSRTVTCSRFLGQPSVTRSPGNQLKPLHTETGCHLRRFIYTRKR